MAKFLILVVLVTLVSLLVFSCEPGVSNPVKEEQEKIYVLEYIPTNYVYKANLLYTLTNSSGELTNTGYSFRGNFTVYYSQHNRFLVSFRDSIYVLNTITNQIIKKMYVPNYDCGTPIDYWPLYNFTKISDDLLLLRKDQELFLFDIHSLSLKLLVRPYLDNRYNISHDRRYLYYIQTSLGTPFKSSLYYLDLIKNTTRLIYTFGDHISVNMTVLKDYVFCRDGNNNLYKFNHKGDLIEKTIQNTGFNYSCMAIKYSNSFYHYDSLNIYKYDCDTHTNSLHFTFTENTPGNLREINDKIYFQTNDFNSTSIKLYDVDNKKVVFECQKPAKQAYSVIFKDNKTF